MKSDSFEIFLKSLGNNLKEARKNKDYTQEKMEELCDIVTRYYQKIEAGKSNITLKTLYRLSEILEVHPSDLLK